MLHPKMQYYLSRAWPGRGGRFSVRARAPWLPMHRAVIEPPLFQSVGELGGILSSMEVRDTVSNNFLPKSNV